MAVAEALQLNLDHACEVAIWSQGVFGLTSGSLESLVEKLDDFDFAILVLTPDDLVLSRDNIQQAPRDNVLLELGLFIGALGRSRTFIVFNRKAGLKIPSDLAGVTLATYEPHANGNLQAALGASSTAIKKAILDLGIRKRTQVNFDIDQNTHFQIISDLLDETAKQLLIIMHEKGLSLVREGTWSIGIPYEYEYAHAKAKGSGHFSVRKLCNQLPDAGLLQIDLRDNVTLTSRGQEYVIWLIERGYKADYFKTSLGGWGVRSDDSFFSRNPFDESNNKLTVVPVKEFR